MLQFSREIWWGFWTGGWVLVGFFRMCHFCWEAHSIFNLFWVFFFPLASSLLVYLIMFWFCFKVKCLCGYGWYFKMDDDSVIYTAVVLCGGILGTDREAAAFNKWKHCSSLTGIVNLNNIKFWGKTWASFTLNLLIKVCGWRNLGLLNQLIFWSLKGKGINRNLSK